MADQTDSRDQELYDRSTVDSIDAPLAVAPPVARPRTDSSFPPVGVESPRVRDVDAGDAEDRPLLPSLA